MRLFWGGDSAFLTNAHLLPLFVANYTMLYFYTLLSAWLAGLGEALANFYSQLANVAATLAVGLPLTFVGGVAGLMGGSLVAITFGAACSTLLLVRVQRRLPLRPSPLAAC